MRCMMKSFAENQDGVTAIEYGLIASGIFLAIVPPVTFLSARMDATYQAILGYFLP